MKTNNMSNKGEIHVHVLREKCWSKVSSTLVNRHSNNNDGK